MQKKSIAAPMSLKVSPQVLFHEVRGEVVLLSLASGSYYGLNAIGSRMWHLLRERGEVEGVVLRLLDEYKVP